MVFSISVVITNFIYLLEVGECSLNKHSLTFPSVYAPSKEYARETVPTILLPTVDQPVVPRQVAMQKATATFTWKLVIDSGSEMVAIKIVLLTVCQSISSLGQVSDIDINSCNYRRLLRLDTWLLWGWRKIKRFS